MSLRLARLKRRADFLRVAARRRHAVRSGLILQAAPSPAETVGDGIRVGFTASRRVGNAVIRNRARRRLRAAAVQVLALDGRKGTDYVLIARAGTARRDFRGLVADLAGALRQIEGAQGERTGDNRLRRREEASDGA
jgi:ribonuclease P protein component